MTFCDGHTQKLAETIDYTVYCQLMSSKGREVKVPGDRSLPNDAPWQGTTRVTEADLAP